MERVTQYIVSALREHEQSVWMVIRYLPPGVWLILLLLLNFLLLVVFSGMLMKLTKHFYPRIRLLLHRLYVRLSTLNSSRWSINRVKTWSKQENERLLHLTNTAMKKQLQHIDSFRKKIQRIILLLLIIIAVAPLVSADLRTMVERTYQADMMKVLDITDSTRMAAEYPEADMLLLNVNRSLLNEDCPGWWLYCSLTKDVQNQIIAVPVWQISDPAPNAPVSE